MKVLINVVLNYVKINSKLNLESFKQSFNILKCFYSIILTDFTIHFVIMPSHSLFWMNLFTLKGASNSIKYIYSCFYVYFVMYCQQEYLKIECCERHKKVCKIFIASLKEIG